MSKEILIFRLRDVADRIEAIHKTGITKGAYLGFENLQEKFSWKPRSTTYMYGSPFSGKTEFAFEIMVNLSEFYGQNHAIYSPESGEAHDIYAELISKVARKPFYSNMKGHLDTSERFNAQAFVDNHFYIIDPKYTDLTIEGFYDQVAAIEAKYDVVINNTWCDPFNELSHDFSGDDGRQDLYIENRLGYIRRNAVANNRHNIILTHSTALPPIQKDGKTFYPPPTPRQISGGQAWHRKAMNMLAIWRPPVGVGDENGVPYEENEVHVIIQKYKPKGVGELGIVRLYLDKERNRYYEKLNGERRYADKRRPFAYQGEQVEYPF